MTEMSLIRTTERYISRLELADIYGVSIRVVDSWVRDGCPSHTWGLRLRRFLPSEVDAWLRQREKAA